MALNKSLFLLLVGLIAFSFLFIALPKNSQAEEEEGCCQFFTGEDPMGCQSLETVESCNEDSTHPGKKFSRKVSVMLILAFAKGINPKALKQWHLDAARCFLAKTPGACIHPLLVHAQVKTGHLLIVRSVVKTDIAKAIKKSREII